MCSKLKIRLLRTLTFILVVLAVACGKNNNPTPINANIVKYFSYKPGTYWIYLDSLTGKIDSFYISYVEHRNVSFSAGGDYLATNEYMACYGIDSLDCLWILQQNYVQFWYEINQYFIPNPIVFSLSYPFILSNTSGQTLLNSYVLFSNNYYNVYEIPISYNRDSTSYHETFYVSIDVGIIKMNINLPNANYKWNLLRYNIIH